MDSHVHYVEEDNLTKWQKAKRNLIHLGISILLILITPWFLGLISSQSISTLRSNAQQANIAGGREYYKGVVTRIVKENVEDPGDGNRAIYFKQILEVEPVEGPDRGKKMEIERQTTASDPKQRFQKEDTVVLLKNTNVENKTIYYVVDKYRLDKLVVGLVVFAIFVVILAGVKGISAFLGLVFSINVLTQYMIPQILIGQNLLLVTFITGLLIMTVSLYLAHGFNKRTSVALLGSVITITIATLVATFLVDFSNLTGIASEEAFNLQFNNFTGSLNLRGLLLSGIIIGCLGIMDDITTAQAASVAEISRANPNLKFQELFTRGMSVGREHITSLINTLALAYAGTSLPLLLLNTVYNFNPLWVTLNDETIAEELIRTLIGSTALLLAVPISTILAAKFLRTKPVSGAGEKLEKAESFSIVDNTKMEKIRDSKVSL